jgi:hypothetical protein
VEREAIPVSVRFVLKVGAALPALLLGAKLEAQEAVGLVVAAPAEKRPGMGRQDKDMAAGSAPAAAPAAAAVAELEERGSLEIITNSGEALA